MICLSPIVHELSSTILHIGFRRMLMHNPRILELHYLIRTWPLSIELDKVIANALLFTPPLRDIHTIPRPHHYDMRLSLVGRRTSSALLLFLAIALLAKLSAAQDTTDANDAATTDDATATATSAETTDTGTSTADSSTSSSTDSSTTSSSSSTSSSYPTVTVPPTAGAPYMQTSSTPEGAVFIAVGAVLGFLGLAVLAWRGLVAWSVNRSVRQQAAAMQSSEKRGLLRSRRRRSSTRSKSRSRSRSGSMPRGQLPSGNLDNGPTGNAAGGYDRHHRHRSGSGSRGLPRMREGPGSSNALFFSPTAGASVHSGKRSSQHHSGYGYGHGYGTASTSTPRASTGPIPTSASLSASERYQPPYKGKRAYPPPPRARKIPIVSPPVSPNPRLAGDAGGYTGLGHSRSLSGDSMSSGSLNPNQVSPPQGRAPSEYLEDLFDGHARPGPDWNRR